MSEGQQFFFIFCLLYLSECVLWVKPQAWVFLSTKWKANLPAHHGGRGRFVLCQPFPPLGWGFVCGERRSEDAVDLVGISAKMSVFDQATRGLRVVSSWMVFPWFFLLVPGTYWYAGPVLFFWVVLLLGWLGLFLTAVFFYRAHKRLYPEKRGERWQHVMLSAIVPQHAMRVCGVLARPWLRGYAPLTVAAALLPRDDAMDLIGSQYRQYVFSPERRENEDAASAYERYLRAVLQQMDVDPVVLVQAPERQGEAVAYCPRCHQQFHTTAGSCVDCGGVRVRAFTSPSECEAS